MVLTADQAKRIWDEIKEAEQGGIEIIEPDLKLEAKPMVCQCCGAPMNGDRCDYCGVTYKLTKQ